MSKLQFPAFGETEYFDDQENRMARVVLIPHAAPTAFSDYCAVLEKAGFVCRELVEKGQLSAGHARALIPIENEKKQLAAAKEVIEKSLSVRKTESMAAKLSRETDDEEKPTKGIKVDYAQEVSNQLSAILGRKVKLIEGRKTGRIELEFYGSDDREALIETLRNIK